jgi:hypothetical protein
MDFLVGDTFSYPTFDGQSIVWIRADEKWVRIVPWFAAEVESGEAVKDDEFVNGYLGELRSGVGVKYVMTRAGTVLEQGE